jgi:hypothetical protein
LELLLPAPAGRAPEQPEYGARHVRSANLEVEALKFRAERPELIDGEGLSGGSLGLGGLNLGHPRGARRSEAAAPGAQRCRQLFAGSATQPEQQERIAVKLGGEGVVDGCDVLARDGPVWAAALHGDVVRVGGEEGRLGRVAQLHDLCWQLAGQ